jgi:hypothetical protein
VHAPPHRPSARHTPPLLKLLHGFDRPCGSGELGHACKLYSSRTRLYTCCSAPSHCVTLPLERETWHKRNASVTPSVPMVSSATPHAPTSASSSSSYRRSTASHLVSSAPHRRSKASHLSSSMAVRRRSSHTRTVYSCGMLHRMAISPNELPGSTTTAPASPTSSSAPPPLGLTWPASSGMVGSRRCSSRWRRRRPCAQRRS